MKEKKQAESDKKAEEETEAAAAGSDLKPGERRVISNGTDGPVVEIIKGASSETQTVPSDSEEKTNENEMPTDEVEEAGE